MVEQALSEKGDISPKELQSHIHEKHGVEIPTTMISSYKSNILRKQGGSTKAGGADASVGVRDITQLRDLIDRVGANQLQSLIKVLSK
ncbi:hypothetical protein FRUB_02928 [Fimbriiglobus ruber]|uniref:Uncharacterized protein n=2 Tax=Fimbriiglobus ruber TaxID=1908690 RepID=A0A225E1G6_9BACT|nr:hypothetical protein FRUB_02928 [Fimbriiglobus ruber]